MSLDHLDAGRRQINAASPDPVGAAFSEHLHAAFGSLEAALDGLTLEELNRAPAPDANSIAVLVAHTVDTARSILHDLVDDPIPRDREAAFRLAVASEDDLRAMLEGWAAELDGLVEQALTMPLDRPIVRFREAPKAWWLLQVLAHTREHAAHAALTRQLVSARADAE